MKLKYIFITPGIRNMGGAQMYIRNKALWLQKQGWEVQVFSHLTGNVIITELIEHNTYIEDMAFPSYYYTKHKQTLVLRRLLSCIDSRLYDRIVIESHCINGATWGEMLAQAVGAKHIVYLLSEDITVVNKELQNFCIFKHGRKELVSIAEKSLKLMFESFHPISLAQSYWLSASCVNVVEDIDSTIIHSVDWYRYDYCVGCLSRIDKPFILPALNQFAKFTQLYKDKKFLMYMIGGATDFEGCKVDIVNIFKHSHNVDLAFSGYIFPVPAKFLEKFDVFFASAGSSLVCMKSGVPTISIDCNDYMPIGVLGRTTKSSLIRGDNEPSLDYLDIFEDVIVGRKYEKLPPKYDILEPDFTKHMTFVEDSSQNVSYFNVEELKCYSIKENIAKLSLLVFDLPFFLKIIELKKKITKKIFMCV